MATILAINDGNWNEPSIWDSGTVPTIDDVVYLNGHTVTANVNIDLGTNGEIRNDEEQGVGAVAGGCVSQNASRTITANLYIGDVYIIHVADTSGAGYSTSIIGDINVIGGATSIRNYVASNQFENISITGNIHLGSACFCNRIRLGFSIVGDIYAEHGYFQSINSSYTSSRLITGDIYLGDNSIGLFSGSTTVGNILSISGNIIGNSQSLVGGKETSNISNKTIINGDIILNDSNLFTDAIEYLEIDGTISQVGTGLVCTGAITNLTITNSTTLAQSGITTFYITTLNMNGTLTQGQGQIASYITTLNLDGTLNLSGTRPFTYGVQNLNVATGGQVTYDNHLYYCFTNIVAVDSNFTITCRNQNLDNFDFKNKNLLNNTYPAQANVSDGYVYGLEDQFTGSYQLPPESVVLEGTPYGSHVGTLTLDISSSVQDTIDDIEDEVNTLVDSYPPLVTLESITNIGNTSATINLSVSNTALITKTGAEVDIDWNFSNPYEYEVNNWATSVSVTGLNPSVQYYVRGYVIYDGNKVYSSANTLQTLLVPPELQLCEYLQTDGNCYINIRPDEFSINNYNARIKYKTIDGTAQGIWGCRTTATTGMLHSQFTATTNSLRLGYANSNNDNTNSSYQQAIQYWNNNNIKVTRWDGTQIRAITPTLSNIFVKNVCLFGTYNNETNTVYYMKSGGIICEFDFTTFDQISRLVSTYIKTGETYEDNKGNTCSAGTCGFFDVLTQTFYTNDGGGNFTHGNDII